MLKEAPVRYLISLAVLVALISSGCGPASRTTPTAPRVGQASIAVTPGVTTVFDVIRAGGIYVKTFADGTKLYRMPNGAPSVIVGPITVVCVVVPDNMQGPLLPGQCRSNGNPQ